MVYGLIVLVVARHFPTYDFVLRTSDSVSDVARKLDEMIALQSRPKGFVIADSRLEGTVSGSTFELRRGGAGLGGSVMPYAEGYFVPSELGSDVVVRVQVSRWWWLFDGVIIASMVSSGALSFESPGVSLFAVAVLASITFLPIWLEGVWIAKQIARALQEAPHDKNR